MEKFLFYSVGFLFGLYWKDVCKYIDKFVDFVFSKFKKVK